MKVEAICLGYQFASCNYIPGYYTENCFFLGYGFKIDANGRQNGFSSEITRFIS